MTSKSSLYTVILDFSDTGCVPETFRASSYKFLIGYIFDDIMRIMRIYNPDANRSDMCTLQDISAFITKAFFDGDKSETVGFRTDNERVVDYNLHASPVNLRGVWVTKIVIPTDEE